MRILIITAVFPPEPVVSAKISRALAAGLASRGHAVTVFAPRPSRPEGFNFHDFNEQGASAYYSTELPGVCVIHADSIISPHSSFIQRLRENYSFGNAAAEYINKNGSQFDSIYVNSWPLFSQYLIARASKKNAIPYYIHIQDIYPESLGNKLPSVLQQPVTRLLMPLERYHLRNAKKVIAISDNMKNYLCSTRGVPESLVDIVYNWQDEDDFIVVQVPRNDKFTYMYLGNIGPVAGVELLIEAFGQADLVNCCLVIAGSGANKKRCMELATLYPSADIRFTDVPEGAVASVQQQADVLLLPVKKGGARSSIPSKLPAYMFSAKPVLAAIDDDSDTANAIIEAECGWVGPPEDKEWLKDSFRRISMLEATALREKGTSGRAYALKNFSKHSNLMSLITIIEN